MKPEGVPTIMRGAPKRYNKLQGQNMKSKYMKVDKFIILILVIILAVTFSACGKDKGVRKYKETGTSGQIQNTGKPQGGMPQMGQSSEMGMGHMPRNHFKWNLPEGWAEMPNQSGMRLATFSVKVGNKEGICTVIPLQGEAGGLEANVSRWLDQVKSEGTKMPEDSLQKILDKQEKFFASNTFPSVLVDFTGVTPKSTDKTIIAGVISLETSSIFFKLMGEKELLEKNKGKLKSLCESFSLITGNNK